MNRIKVLVALFILIALALVLVGQVSGEPAGDDVIVSGAKAMITKGITRSPELEAATANTEPHSIAMYADAGKLMTLIGAPGDLLAQAAQAEQHVSAQYADANRWSVLSAIPAELQAVTALVAPRVRYHRSDAGIAREMSYPKALFNDAIPPVISNVRLAGVGQGAVAVLWTTDEWADSQVVYGPAPGVYSGVVSSSLFEKEHRVVLTGLTPKATYYFTVSSVDRSGNAAKSAEGSFKAQTRLYLPLLQRG